MIPSLEAVSCKQSFIASTPPLRPQEQSCPTSIRNIRVDSLSQNLQFLKINNSQSFKLLSEKRGEVPIQRKQFEHLTKKRSYQINSSRKRDRPSLRLGGTAVEIIQSNNSIISDSIKKQKMEIDLPILSPSLSAIVPEKPQGRTSSISPSVMYIEDQFKRSLFHFSNTNKQQAISNSKRHSKLNISSIFQQSSFPAPKTLLSSTSKGNSSELLNSSSSLQNLPFSQKLANQNINMQIPNTSSNASSALKSIQNDLKIITQKNIQRMSMQHIQTFRLSPRSLQQNGNELSLFKKISGNEVITNKSCTSSDQKGPAKKLKNKEKSIIIGEETMKGILTAEEKEQIEKIKKGGLSSYVKAIYFDCEYLFKSDLDNQTILLSDDTNLQNNTVREDQISPPSKSAQLFLNIEKQEEPNINEFNYFQQDKSTKNINEKSTSMLKECEIKLCKAIANKKLKGKSQIEEVQSILINNLEQNLSQVNNLSLKLSLKEVIQALLILQVKRHMIVENEKREGMIDFLKRQKKIEETFEISLFGKEINVEAFRFKLGEIYVENNRLLEEMRILKCKNESLLEQLSKQKKNYHLLKTEYFVTKGIQENLAKKLQQKYESYYKRFARQDQIEKNTPSNNLIKELSASVLQSQSSSQQPNKDSPQIKKGPLYLTPLSKITLLNSPNSRNSENTKLTQASQEFVKMAQHSKGNNDESQKSEDEVDSVSSEECADIEKILIEARQITKVENNDVMIKEIQEDIPILYYNQETQTDPAITEYRACQTMGIQTDLQLVSSDFNHIMSNDRLNQLSKQEDIKEQLQNISLYSSAESIDNNTENSQCSEEDRFDENYNAHQMKKSQEIKPSQEGETKQKEIDKKFQKRISVINILKGLPLEKRKKKAGKNDIENLIENVNLLKGFLQSSPPESDTSINFNEPQEERQRLISKSKFTVKPNDFSNAKQILNKEAQQFLGSKSKSPVPLIKFTANSSLKKIPSIESINHISNSPMNNSIFSKNNNQNLSFKAQGKAQGMLKQVIEKQIYKIENSQHKIQSHGLIEVEKTPTAHSFGHSNTEELREQILSIIKFYNLETEKSKNYEESIEQLLNVMKELFIFCYKVVNHVQKTQKDTYKSVVEQFFQTFTAIRWKIPQEIDQKLEEDLYPEQALKRKLAARKKQLKDSQANVPRAQGILFANMRLANKLTIQDKSVHPGIVLVKKLKEAGLPKKFNGYLPLKTVLRQINGIIIERAKNIAEQRLARDTELSIYIFNRFLHQYGFKNVAEQKFLHFLMNVINYQQIFRINVFARLTGVLQRDEDNYSVDEMDKYMNGWQFLIYQSNMGQNLNYNESDLRVFCHYLRCYDYLKQKMEKILTIDQINELKQFIEQNKENDTKNVNNQNSGKCVMDVDSFLSKVMEKYRIIMNQTKVSVKNAFLACDMDGNGTINLNEFLTLFRHIEAEKFSFGKVCKMFEQTADIITVHEKCLSFQKFTALCLQEQLFKESAQRKFLEIYEKNEINGVFTELRDNWTQKKQILSDRIEQLKPFVQIETYKIWKEILLVLQDRIMKNNSVVLMLESNPGNYANNEESDNNQNQESPSLQQLQSEYAINVVPILIAYKLLQSELVRLLDVGQTEDLNFQDDDDDEGSDFGQEEECDDNSNPQIKTEISQGNNNSQLELQKDLTVQFSVDEDGKIKNQIAPEITGAQKLQLLKAKEQNKNNEIIDAQIYQFSDEQVVKENLRSKSQATNKKIKPY